MSTPTQPRCAIKKQPCSRKTVESAKAIRPTLTHYAQHRSGDAKGEFDACITDVLADVMHFCHAEEIDFDKHLRSARDHFAVEADPQYAEGR